MKIHGLFKHVYKMKELKIKDIIYLVEADIDDPKDQIQKIYEWNFERKMTLVKGFVGFSVSLIVALLFSYLKSEIKEEISWWEIGIALLFAGLTGTYGFYQYFQIEKIGNHFIAALKLHKKLLCAKTFIANHPIK